MTYHRTAISRRKVSAPAKWLGDQGLMVGRVLDFGCGRGFDAKALSMEAYEPSGGPDMPEGKFDTVYCGYVLNVLECPLARNEVLWQIKQNLGWGGKAYIAVRADKKSFNGKTKAGTWQGDIYLDLPLVRQTSGYRIYLLEY